MPEIGARVGGCRDPIPARLSHFRVKEDAEFTKSDRLIHGSVVEAVHGLTDIVGVARKRVPAQVPWDAERLGCSYSAGTIRTSRATNRPGCRRARAGWARRQPYFPETPLSVKWRRGGRTILEDPQLPDGA